MSSQAEGVHQRVLCSIWETDIHHWREWLSEMIRLSAVEYGLAVVRNSQLVTYTATRTDLKTTVLR